VRTQQIIRRSAPPVETDSLLRCDLPRTWRGAFAFAWLVLIHLTAAFGLCLYPRPGWILFFAFLLLAFVGGVGTTVGYHRSLAHRSVSLHPAVRWVLIFFAMLNGAGAPVNWVATHVLHHATADTPDDPTSPLWRGFWWAHAGWIWDSGHSVPLKYAADVQELAYWNRLLAPILAASYLGGAAFGPAAFFWLGSLRLVLAFNATSFVNSVCHRNPVARSPAGGARNVLWLALPQLLLGENWHLNHHLRPRSPRLGLTWWQPDLGYSIVIALQKLHLARISTRMHWRSVENG
jgi:stearoyl-CoA desaturase (delta-9 desaturase)